jgi:hypothetical protein
MLNPSLSNMGSNGSHYHYITQPFSQELQQIKRLLPMVVTNQRQIEMSNPLLKYPLAIIINQCQSSEVDQYYHAVPFG